MSSYILGNPLIWDSNSFVSSLRRVLITKLNAPFQLPIFTELISEVQLVGNTLPHRIYFRYKSTIDEIYVEFIVMLDRLVTDLCLLVELHGADFGRICSIYLLGDERDWGNRLNVLFITDLGFKFVYKNKPCAIEEWFARSLPNIHLTFEDFVCVPQSVDRGDYSWHLYKEGSQNPTALTVKNGRLLLEWMKICRLTDLYSDNVAVANGQLVLYDLEMAFQPYKVASTSVEIDHCMHFSSRSWTYALLGLESEIFHILGESDSSSDIPENAIDNVPNSRNRVVFLPTTIYQKIIVNAAKIDLVEDGNAKYSYVSNSIRNLRCLRPIRDIETIEHEEISSLLVNKIPRFWGKVDECILGSCGRIVAFQYFDLAGKKAARSVL